MFIYHWKAAVCKRDADSIQYKTTAKMRAIHSRYVNDKIDTIEKVFRDAVQRHGDKIALGTRQVLAEEDELQPNGKSLKKVVYIRSSKCTVLKPKIVYSVDPWWLPMAHLFPNGQRSGKLWSRSEGARIEIKGERCIFCRNSGWMVYSRQRMHKAEPTSSYALHYSQSRCACLRN